MDFGKHDVIDACGMGLTNWAQVESHPTYTGEGAVLTVGSNSVLLANVTRLTTNDFLLT
jgi:hypothetical protein